MIKDEVDVELKAIFLDEILKKMQKTKSELNIIILDVSPDTPYLEPHYKSKIISYPKEAPVGTIIGYATSSDSTILREVSNTVKWESNGKQVPLPPLLESTEKFCFGDCTTKLKMEDISLTKSDERQVEQKLNLSDLEKKFIIWA